LNGILILHEGWLATGDKKVWPQTEEVFSFLAIFLFAVRMRSCGRRLFFKQTPMKGFFNLRCVIADSRFPVNTTGKLIAFFFYTRRDEVFLLRDQVSQ
jgi:hypothetical protein